MASEGFLRSIKPDDQTRAGLPGVWYALPCGVTVYKLALAELRFHGRRCHGYRLITPHNKTQHQVPLFIWDKEEQGHLKLFRIPLRGWLAGWLLKRRLAGAAP